MVQHALLLEIGEDLREGAGAERLPVAKRQLERGALQVAGQDEQVVGVGAGLFHRMPEQVLRMGDHELVEGGARAHQDRERGLAPPARAAHLLPRAGDRPGIPHQDRGGELADVDAELQGVRRRDRPQGAAAEPRFDPPALAREVPGPVAADRSGVPSLPAGILLEIRRQQLRAEARARKEDRLDPPRQQLPGDGHRLADGVAPDPEGLVDDRRVVQPDGPRPSGRAALVDQRDRAPDEPLRMLARVGDRGRATDDLRRAAVEAAHPEEAAEHVGEVGPKHSPVGVQLVEHDESQVLEQAEPFRVMRKDARVQHIRVRDHDVAGGADRAPRIVRGVAVVGRRPEVDAERLDEAVKFVHLIARQRLGREQVQRAGVPALEDGVDDREVVAEGLARGGGRDDDDVGPARDLTVRHRLVRIELPDAPPPEGIGQPGVQIGREVLIPRLHLGKRAPGGKLRGKARPGAQGVEDLLKRHLPGLLVSTWANPRVSRTPVRLPGRELLSGNFQGNRREHFGGLLRQFSGHLEERSGVPDPLSKVCGPDTAGARKRRASTSGWVRPAGFFGRPLDGRYCTCARAATAHVSTTRPCRTHTSRSARLTVGHTCEGMISTRSPTRNRRASSVSCTRPCSSHSRSI